MQCSNAVQFDVVELCYQGGVGKWNGWGCSLSSLSAGPGADGLESLTRRKSLEKMVCWVELVQSNVVRPAKAAGGEDCGDFWGALPMILLRSLNHTVEFLLVCPGAAGEPHQ